MLVGSHAETGDERKAAVAPLPPASAPFRPRPGSAPCGARPALPLKSRPAALEAGPMPAGSACCGSRRSPSRSGSRLQAADPDVTIPGRRQHHIQRPRTRSFELVTKEAVPRRFLVEDPGETIILRSQGSSVSVSQSTNTRARMDELQAAQQDALAIFEKGLEPTGSSTPPFVEPTAGATDQFHSDRRLGPRRKIFLPPPAWITRLSSRI